MSQCFWGVRTYVHNILISQDQSICLGIATLWHTLQHPYFAQFQLCYSDGCTSISVFGLNTSTFYFFANRSVTKSRPLRKSFCCRINTHRQAAGREFVLEGGSPDHSSRIRFLRFLKFQKNATFYVFLKWHFKKT